MLKFELLFSYNPEIGLSVKIILEFFLLINAEYEYVLAKEDVLHYFEDGLNFLLNSKDIYEDFGDVFFD